MHANANATAAYKTRTSDEALAEHLKLQLQLPLPLEQPDEQQRDQPLATHTFSQTVPMRRGKQLVAPPSPPPPPPPEPLRINGTGIYVISSGGGGGTIVSTTNATDGAPSNPATLDRRQANRMSWTNMRRQGDAVVTANATVTATATSPAAATTAPAAPPVTPSPQTTRSYISNVSMMGGGATATAGGGGGGTMSGRTTATSGHISTSGVTTTSGSNNTLNDIISDYHSHEAGSSSDYQYSGAGLTRASPLKNLSSNGSFNLANGSTVKLLPPIDDEKNQQTKCSVFRGLVLCICLNVTYANVVRFPRELDRHGSAYLIPYLVLLFLVGLPILLLEISVGQFLGQGAAHTWRASPIFKGACIISRFASWLSTVWVSMQAVLAVAYIGMFLINKLPFRECVGPVKVVLNRYTTDKYSGQECLQRTFLQPFWDNPLFFGLLAIGLIGIWIVVMLCTHNGRILRRSLFFLGLLGFVLLSCLTGWEVHNSFERSYFPELWSFDGRLLIDSNIWFDALMQVLFALNCGFGALPMVTGKFLYKGDAVRTSVVYLCFNLLINAIAVTLFMVQFDHSQNSGFLIDELKPLTAIYDRAILDQPNNELLARVMASLTYTLILIAALVSVCVAIYTSTRLVPRHPNYVVSLIALVMAIISLAAPRYMIARILDSRVVGTMAITALIFELIAITWIYGAKNIYTDLEFSIGRPILKGWMGLWCLCPAILTGLLVWWCSDDDQHDLIAEYMPRWAPILIALAVIFLIACIQIFRQVEYNFFGMICEASKSAKEWGPADPLARHAWKQWRSVCQDTGRRDFTLRRRGTRDYTHSIKKGQYSTTSNNKYVNGGHAAPPHWKSSTPGNSSPNYSGSMFGDSAIEEDISVDKFPGVAQQFVPFQANDSKQQPAPPLRYSHRARLQQRQMAQQHHQHHYNHQQQHSQQAYPQQAQPQTQHVDRAPPPPPSTVEKHREVVYIRRLSSDGQHATRIEITPSNESITYGGGGGGGGGGATRNPLGRAVAGAAVVPSRRLSSGATVNESNRHAAGANGNGGAKLPPLAANGNVNSDHICWRKFSVRTQEYSTEL